MTTSTSSKNLTQYLRQMLRTWEHDDRSDAELLALFVQDRNEQAFATLVRRYSLLVWGVCYRILGHHEEAEDAFQAAFLVLARKAGQIYPKEMVGHWLYGVAQRTAQDVRKSIARRRRHENQASTLLPTTYTDEEARPELLAVLDEEIMRLPTDYRVPLILCRLEGHTYKEAARSLGCSTAAVGRRVARAEELLRDRLTRRGLSLAGVSVAALLSQTVTAKGMPLCLMGETIRAAQAFAGGTLAPNVAVTIAQGVMQSMASSKAVLWGIVLATLIGVAVGVTTQFVPTAQGVVPPAANAASPVSSEEPRRDRYGDPLPPGALARLGTMRLRHAEGVHSLAFTRDGKGLLTAGGKSDPIQLWDITTGRILRRFGGGASKPTYCTAVLSPDGRTVVGSIGAEGNLGLWDITTGTLLHQLKGGQADDPTQLAFSPDGKMVAASDGTTLHLWETATGEELWAAGRGRIASFTYSADSKALIWSGFDGDVHLWDAATSKELRRWDDDKKCPISILARAPDGRLFVVYDSGAAGNFAHLWDVAADREVWRLAIDKGSIGAAAFSPDGKVLAAAGVPCGSLCLRDAATGKELRRCEGYPCVQSLAFSPDGKTLASGSQSVRLWEVSSGHELRRPLIGHEVTVCSVTFTPDGKDIVSSSQDGSLRLWDAGTGEQRRQIVSVGDEHFIKGTNSIVSTVSSDGKVLFSASWDSIESSCRLRVRRWDRESGRELEGWSQAVENGYAPVISSDGQIVACTSCKASPNSNPVVRHWGMATGKELALVAGAYPALSPDGKLLATAPLLKQGESGSFTLWEAATGKELCSVPLPEKGVYRLLFSPDGRMLVTMSNGLPNGRKAIHLWPLLRDEAHKSLVRVGLPRKLAVVLPLSWFGAWAFSPDGRTLALSEEQGTIRLVETASGKERGRFAGHRGHVETLSFAADGRRLASGSRDTTILVWDVTGRLQGERGTSAPRLWSARLSDQELENLWGNLASDSAGRAGRAIWTLAAAPDQTVPYLRERLRALAADAKERMAEIPQLLRDLDDDTFTVRERARSELALLGAGAESALRQALAKKGLSLEVRRSLEQLLQTLEAERQAPSGKSLRGVRALEVLEHIGTRQAWETLKAVASGAGAESSLAQEARIALERLNRAER